MGMFSIHDAAAAESLQVHYTSPKVANGSNGANEVNGDTIYRIASVTKLVTVMQLAETSDKGHNDPVHLVQWDKVTPRALAAEIAGILRDAFSFGPGELNLQAAEINLTALGFPPLDPSNDPVWSFVPCASSDDPTCIEDLDNYVASV